MILIYVEQEYIDAGMHGVAVSLCELWMIDGQADASTGLGVVVGKTGKMVMMIM